MQVLAASPLQMMAPPGSRRSVAPKQTEPADVVTLSAPAAPEQASSKNGWGAAIMLGLSLAGTLASPAYAGLHGTDQIPGISQPFHHDHGQNWDVQTVEGGWQIPRNEGLPVQPRFGFPVREGTTDLGPTHVLDNTRGRIRAVRLQWPNETDPRAARAHEAMFRDLLTRLPQDARFEIVAESGGEAALRELIAQTRVVHPERIEIHSMGLRSSREELYQAMSMWTRDGAVVLTRASDGQEIVLLPHSFRDDGQVDRYLNRVILQGTGEAPASLAGHEGIIVRRSTLDFEGGNVVANGRHVLISPATIGDNVKRMGLSEAEVVARFQAEFGREVIVASPEPDFHIDMGLSFLDDHTVVVASPQLAERLLEGQPHPGISDQELTTMREQTRDKDLARKYDELAGMLQGRGYRVLRMPNLAGRALSSPYMTYQNVLIENYAGVKRVYMPVYGVPATDRAARDAYRAEGFEVIEIPAAQLSTRLGGGIRCAVGELDILQ